MINEWMVIFAVGLEASWPWITMGTVLGGGISSAAWWWDKKKNEEKMYQNYLLCRRDLEKANEMEEAAISRMAEAVELEKIVKQRELRGDQRERRVIDRENGVDLVYKELEFKESTLRHKELELEEERKGLLAQVKALAKDKATLLSALRRHRNI